MDDNAKMRLYNMKLDINNILYNEPMKNHTSFKVGGPADILVEPADLDELRRALKLLKESQIPVLLIGNGTNLLVSDSGIRGAVVKIADKFSRYELSDNMLIAEGGALLSVLSKAAAARGLTGFEFASGIPGTLGGAVAMNAGAYGGEMKDVIDWVELLDEDLNIIRLDNEQMNFGYRKSYIQQNNCIVYQCCMTLKFGDQRYIDELMHDLTAKRKSKQPLHLPSAGSTFKRPEGYFAGKLIEDAGLRGASIGGAQVSELHCGFVVNTGTATAKDVHDLIRHVQKTVHEKFGVNLDTEVKMIGEF